MQPAGSAIQTEFEFPGADADSVSGTGTYPSDEEILGIDDARSGVSGVAPVPLSGMPNAAEASLPAGFSADSSARGEQAQNRRQDAGATHTADARAEADRTAAGAAPAWLRAIVGDARLPAEARAEARELWAQHAAFRVLFPGGAREAQALKEIFPGGARDAQALKEIFPGGLAEAHQAAARAAEFGNIDRAYFSGEAPAQAELANWLLRDNPEAFRAMLHQGARVLADRDPAAFAEFARAFGTATAGQFATPFAELGAAAVPAGSDRSAGFQPANLPSDGTARSDAATALGDAKQNRRQDAGATKPAPLTPAHHDSAQHEWAQVERARGELRAEQFAAFQHSANDAVVEHVRGSIAQTLGSVLPANVSDAARERLAEAVFQEINTTLQRDPALTEQVAAVARSWRFDAATRQQVVDLIARRARQMVAPVAKRVVGEWTASFVGAHRARSQRLEQAAARVDLVGGGAPETVSRRALSPRELDYTALTDEQILSL